ncbi:hypothetical protein H310_08866 [Aphanomyces invadans]|uniref:Glycylpeptide N-tetradecanoyltransferase n=1 Tax=Aphanomyces invadans TaxID=157072 RepID=A0A024TXN5_9STRA|nr:hypothetical protein H310_08866 [Aphanomyces invadans]ETV98122.1 hypothetical protein H310_08866 [Aphanomyces invadans]|eukprot:XP_008872997.1 hypothetical protein H310_08866 [Aphanomyces invadans]
MPATKRGEKLMPSTPSSNQADTADFLAVLKQLNLPPPTASVATTTQPPAFKFWRTQPVMSSDDAELLQEHGYCDESIPVSSVRETPLKLPDGFVWSAFDIHNSDDVNDLYKFLAANYCEDSDGRFRSDYSVEFLVWALSSPQYVADWHVAIRHRTTGKLMAFFAGVYKVVRVHHDVAPTCETNFLCIHPKLRSKRLAPVLIKEMARRTKLQAVWRAVYTGSSHLPTPVATTQIYHRSLNTKKCVEVGFALCPPNVSLTSLIKAQRLPESPSIPGFQPMQVHHVPDVTALLVAHHTRFDLALDWTDATVAHWLLPRPHVVSSYVVVDPATNRVTDVCSYYHVPMTVLKHPHHTTLSTAQSFYNVATSVPLHALVQDLLVSAKAERIDIFSAADIMDMDQVLAPLGFDVGGGHLHYYLFNWRCPRMSRRQVALVLH